MGSLSSIKRFVKPPAAWAARRLPGRRVEWGTLRRTEPFSVHYGYRRGDPVDRRYIEHFLERHRALIRGRVMEVGSAQYTRALGGAAVSESEVVDVDRSNAEATLVADLAAPHSLAPDRYDCIILVHTLQYLADTTAGLANAWRSLRGGGALLVTAPCLSRLDPLVPAADLWRWTPAGLDRGIAATCDGAYVEVAGYGNVLACVAFLLGLAQQELTPAELDAHDPSFPLVACACARKPAG
jgi:hypothetical protein